MTSLIDKHLAEIEELKLLNKQLTIYYDEMRMNLHETKQTIITLNKDNKELKELDYNHRTYISELQSTIARLSGYIDRIKECEVSGDIKHHPPIANMIASEVMQATPQGYNPNFNASNRDRRY